MTHETQNIARRHAIAARRALSAFRCQQTEVGMDWNRFDKAMVFLDQALEELDRKRWHRHPAMLAGGGFPAAMAYLIEEIQTAAGQDMVSRQHPIAADVPPKWKLAAIRITQESLANACRHSKSKRIFLELTLDGNVLRIHARDWGAGFEPDATVPARSRRGRTDPPIKLLGGTAIIESERGKGTYVNVEIPLAQQRDADRCDRLTTGPRR